MQNGNIRRITKSLFEKKRKEYRQKQESYQNKIDSLQEADENYYLTSEYLLTLASRAQELIKSSKPEQKRQILKLTVQNLVLDGNNVRFDWQKPFDTIAKHADRQEWLPLLD